MNERIKELLEETKRIQAARRENWPTPDRPTDAALEAQHLAACREAMGEMAAALKLIAELAEEGLPIKACGIAHICRKALKTHETAKIDTNP